MTLGNHADAFHLTPMRTSITKGGNARMGRMNSGAMPSPRGSGSSTQVVLAGFGDDTTDTAPSGPDAGGASIDPTAQTSAPVVLGPPAPAAAPKSNMMLIGGALAAAAALWWFTKGSGSGGGSSAAASPRKRTYRRRRTISRRRRSVRRDHRGRFLAHR